MPRPEFDGADDFLWAEEDDQLYKLAVLLEEDRVAAKKSQKQRDKEEAEDLADILAASIEDTTAPKTPSLLPLPLPPTTTNVAAAAAPSTTATATATTTTTTTTSSGDDNGSRFIVPALDEDENDTCTLQSPRKFIQKSKKKHRNGSGSDSDSASDDSEEEGDEERKQEEEYKAKVKANKPRRGSALAILRSYNHSRLCSSLLICRF